MKKLILEILILLLFFGCNQENPVKSLQPFEVTIYGTWDWKQSSGGLFPQTKTPKTEGYSIKRIFTYENIVHFYKNDSLIRSSIFTLERDVSIYTGDSAYFIVYEDNNWPEVIQSLSIDTLILADNKVDGFGSSYERIQHKKSY